MKLPRNPLEKFSIACVLLFLNFIIPLSGIETPTTWQIHNQTDEDLSLSCKNKARGLHQPILFPKVKIKKREVFDYTWSEAYYNDGMGLNSGIWTCSIHRGHKKVELYFTTDFGEKLKLHLILVNGKVKIEKVSGND